LTKDYHRSVREFHAAERAAQRHGIEIFAEDIDHIKAIIQKYPQDKSECRFLERKSGTKTVFNVRVYDKWIPVMYDKTTHSVCTILPKNCHEKRCHIKTWRKES